MQKISRAIRTGASAFLKRQYRTVAVFFACMFVVLCGMAAAGFVTWFVPFAFVTGGFFSGLSGFIGMTIATRANCRTAAAAQEGLNRGLRIAFSGGCWAVADADAAADVTVTCRQGDLASLLMGSCQLEGMLRLGAASAKAVDIDDKCLTVAYENAALNGIGKDRYTVLVGDVLSNGALREALGSGYDVVVANIVADVIIGLAPMVRQFLKPGGLFLCSGIIDTRAGEVADALRQNGWEIETTRAGEGWYSYACR